jgi:hypothetical protein
VSAVVVDTGVFAHDRIFVDCPGLDLRTEL